MKNFKYVFLIVGIIYLLEIVYTFFKPSESYEIFSFNVPFFAFIIFRLFIALSFLMLYKQSGANENKS
jgi:hypothetical protein